MQTIEQDLLDATLGGARDSTNPAGLHASGGCPVPSPKNDSLAKTWNKSNAVTKDSGGNYTKADGPFPNLYRYEYFNGSRCAPGADD